MRLFLSALPSRGPSWSTAPKPESSILERQGAVGAGAGKGHEIQRAGAHLLGRKVDRAGLVYRRGEGRGREGGIQGHIGWCPGQPGLVGSNPTCSRRGGTG